jgi:DNA-binding transcriptional MerR regulator
MKNFTITDIERFTGIKAHTIRVWERRYNTITPLRTGGNFRVYTLAELEKLLCISLLIKSGHRISDVCCLDLCALESKIENASSENLLWQKAINKLFVFMHGMQPELFENVLDKVLSQTSIDNVIENIIYPFLINTGLLWCGNKSCEEHLAVTTIRKKLILAIESNSPVNNSNKTVLLFLPDNKQLDLGLIYTNYYLKRRGIKVMYLGNDISPQNLENIFEIFTPEFAFTYLPQNKNYPTSKWAATLNTLAPGSKLIIGNYPEQGSGAFHENIISMDFMSALDYLHTSITN